MTVAPRAVVLLAAGLVALTIAAYLPAIHGGFIWDDDSYVTANPLLENVDGLVRIWSEPAASPQYYPAVFTTFWIERQLWDLNPLGFHLVNVLLHALNALLVWRILTRLGVPGAAIAAAIFALHPVHVESVAWITERKNVLSATFYLAAFLSYLRFDERRNETTDEGGGAFLWYALALVLFVFALLGKTVTCSLPVAIGLALVHLRRPLNAKNLLPLVPLLAIGLVLALHTAHLERVRVGAWGPDFDHTLLERGLIAARALVFYPSKLIAPWPLIFIYPRWAIDTGSLASWWPVLVLAAVAAACVFAWQRGWRGPALALAFFAATIFPALGFVNVYPHLFSFVADHFQYLASLGPITLVAAGYAMLVRDPSRRMLFAAAPLALLAMLTWIQASMYQDAETVWRDTLEKNPDAWMPSTNLSSILLQEAGTEIAERRAYQAVDLIEEARVHAEAALRVRPHHHTAHNNLSEALRLQGDLEGALHHMEAALAERDLVDYHILRANLLRSLLRLEEARAGYETALARVEPGTPVADALSFELGRVLVLLGEIELARPHLETAVAGRPEHALSLIFLGEVEDRSGRDAEAISLYLEAMEAARSRDDRIQAAFRVARVMAISPDDSVRNGQRALGRAGPLVEVTGRQNPYVFDVLGMAFAENGRFEQAIDRAEKAKALALEQGLDDFAREIETRLESYRRQEPWRE